MRVIIGLQARTEAALRGIRRPVPDPIRGLACVDTGAGVSAIDLSVARRLELEPTNYTNVNTATGSVTMPVFVCALEIIGVGRFGFVSVLGCNIQDEISLIGMDILSQCVFTMDGPSRTFTLDLM